jgi:four helix bundle protein
MKKRTKEFAMEVIHPCRQIPVTREGRLIGSQLFRAGTSVGANYRAACRGRSRADFISKIGIVHEEADKSLSWLEILSENGIENGELVKILLREASELISIFVVTLKTAKSR